jgi:hypothetical protein
MTLFSLEDLGFGAGEERLGQEQDDDEAEADPLRALLSQERVHLVATRSASCRSARSS